MVLTGIEEHLRTARAETQDAPSNLHIEHVLPQAWHKNWPIENDDDEVIDRRDHMIHTIGNLTLVSGPLNSSLSNAAWDRKKEVLAEHSVLYLNKHLVNDAPQTWNEISIEARAMWLHERAILVWPHSADTRVP